MAIVQILIKTDTIYHQYTLQCFVKSKLEVTYCVYK